MFDKKDNQKAMNKAFQLTKKILKEVNKASSYKSNEDKRLDSIQAIADVQLAIDSILMAEAARMLNNGISKQEIIRALGKELDWAAVKKMQDALSVHYNSLYKNMLSKVPDQQGMIHTYIIPEVPKNIL